LPKMSEEALQKDGFRKIKGTYGGRCSYCGQPYSAGEEIYWKRDPATSVCCPRCYSGKGRTVRCPSCGVEFEIAP